MLNWSGFVALNYSVFIYFFLYFPHLLTSFLETIHMVSKVSNSLQLCRLSMLSILDRHNHAQCDRMALYSVGHMLLFAGSRCLYFCHTIESVTLSVSFCRLWTVKEICSAARSAFFSGNLFLSPHSTVFFLFFLQQNTHCNRASNRRLAWLKDNIVDSTTCVISMKKAEPA